MKRCSYWISSLRRSRIAALHRIRLPLKNPFHDRNESVNRLPRIAIIERRLIPLFAEVDCLSIVRVIFVSIASMAVPAVVMTVVKRLEQAMMLDDPTHVFTDKRPQNLRCCTIMILRRQTVGNVMEKCCNYPVVVRTFAQCTRRTLKRMFKPRDPVTFKCVVLLTTQFV